MSCLATQLIKSTIDKMRAYEARLTGLKSQLSELEAIRVPEGKSVAAAFDQMQNGPVAWTLIETAARQTYAVKFADKSGFRATNYFALIVSQLLKGICYEYLDDSDDYSAVEPEYSRVTELEKHKRKVRDAQDDSIVCTRNLFSVDPLPLYALVRALLTHVKVTKELEVLLLHFGQAIEIAVEAVAVERACESGKCCEREDSEDSSGCCGCETSRTAAEETLEFEESRLLDAIVSTPAFDTLRPLIEQAFQGRQWKYENYQVAVLANQDDEKRRAASLKAEKERRRKIEEEALEREAKYVEEMTQRAAAAREQLNKKKAKLV